MHKYNSKKLTVNTVKEGETVNHIEIESPYADFSAYRNKDTNEVFYKLTSREGACVAILDHQKGKGPVVLLTKNSLDGPPELPGGYIRPGVDFFDKVLSDTGVRVIPKNIVKFGEVVGHTEIITPIKLYYTWDFEVKNKDIPGTIIIWTPIYMAEEMARKGQLRDTSSQQALYALAYDYRNGYLKPPSRN